MSLFCIKRYRPTRNRGRLFGRELDIEQILEPDEILWHNLGITGSGQRVRQFATFVVTLLIVAVTTVASFYAKGLAQLVDQEVRIRECTSPVDKMDAYFDDQIAPKVYGTKSSNLLQCYCQQNIDPWDFADAYAHDFIDAQRFFKERGDLAKDEEEDGWNYCMEFWTYKYMKDVTEEVLDESAVVFNELIAAAFITLGKYQGAHT